MSSGPLKHYDEFKRILAAYKISDQAKNTLKDIKLVLMLAPTSGGRNTIIRHLVKTGRYHYVVSDTTRKPRLNDGQLEQNGVEYWFRTEEEMLADLKAGKFLEAELIHGQQVSGMSIRELQSAKQADKIAITDVDIEGVHNIIRVKPDAVAIMLLPPSYEEWQQRLARRSHMGQVETQRRLETAYKIFQDGLKQTYYNFVISENIDQSGKIIDSVVKGGPNPHQGRGAALLQHLQGGLETRPNH